MSGDTLMTQNTVERRAFSYAGLSLACTHENSRSFKAAAGRYRDSIKLPKSDYDSPLNDARRVKNPRGRVKKDLSRVV